MRNIRCANKCLLQKSCHMVIFLVLWESSGTEVQFETEIGIK